LILRANGLKDKTWITPSWLRAIESDLAPLNIGLATAIIWHKTDVHEAFSCRNSTIHQRISQTMMMMIIIMTMIKG